MTNFIEIDNNGPELVSTNYWDMKHAQKGFFYFSWNAGAGRLLVPKMREPMIKDMLTAEFVIVSRGDWNGREALELLFEDNTSAPFSINLVTDQCDRLIPETDQGSGFIVTIWTQAGKQATFDGKYRIVNKLPCLKSWDEH